MPKDNEYYNENKDKILLNKKKYYQENKESILKNRKRHYKENKKYKQKYNKIYYISNKEYILENSKIYYKQNKNTIRKYFNKYIKIRRINDPNFRIRAAISANINYYLKKNNSSKNGISCLENLSYSIQELKEHLEGQFESWINWNNYGIYDVFKWDDNDQSTWTWQIDHIIPQSMFNYTSMEDQAFKDCWALSNLRPLNSKQNFIDGVKRSRHII